MFGGNKLLQSRDREVVAIHGPVFIDPFLPTCTFIDRKPYQYGIGYMDVREGWEYQ
jgi:hypothetical protein